MAVSQTYFKRGRKQSETTLNARFDFHTVPRIFYWRGTIGRIYCEGDSKSTLKEKRLSSYVVESLMATTELLGPLRLRECLRILWRGERVEGNSQPWQGIRGRTLGTASRMLPKKGWRQAGIGFVDGKIVRRGENPYDKK